MICGYRSNQQHDIWDWTIDYFGIRCWIRATVWNSLMPDMMTNQTDPYGPYGCVLYSYISWKQIKPQTSLVSGIKASNAISHSPWHGWRFYQMDVVFSLKKMPLCDPIQVMKPGHVTIYYPPMDTYECLWIPMDTYGYHQPIDLRIPMDVSMDVSRDTSWKHSSESFYVPSVAQTWQLEIN